MTTGRPDQEPSLENIQGITNVRPISRGRRPRRLLAVARPRGPLSKMSTTDIEDFAGQLVGGMAEQIAGGGGHGNGR